MARPSLFHHRKFRTLSRLLKSRALAVGSLELIWAAANDAGDPLIGTGEDVEHLADWHGKRGALVAALVACGFIDEAPEGLMVHDHDHHCPEYVRRRRARERARRTVNAQEADTGRITDGSVTGQWSVSDGPLNTTPISHLPSPQVSTHRDQVSLMGGPHPTHAKCGPVCVPRAIWRDMIAARGGDEAYVNAYVEKVWDSLNGQTAPLDQFKFWRMRWDQDHVQPQGPQEIQYKRAWECRCGEIHEGSEAQYRAHWCPKPVAS